MQDFSQYDQLPLKVTKRELVASLTKRADYHAGRAEDFNARAAKARETKSINGVKLDDVIGPVAAFRGFPGYQGRFPGADTVKAAAKIGLKAAIQGLRKTAQRHEDRATTLRFYAEHLPDGESFLLSPMDLGRFELLPRSSELAGFAHAYAPPSMVGMGGVHDYVEAGESEGFEDGESEGVDDGF